MHIVMFNDDALPDSKGGAAMVVDGLMRAYEKEGHKVTLVTTHQDPAKGKYVRRNGIISVLSNYPLKKRHRHCLGNAGMREMLMELFEELKPDAVHAHNIHTHLTYESLLIARRHTANIVLTAHDVFLVAFHRVLGKRFERLAKEGKPIRMHWWEHLFSVGRKYWPLRNLKIRKILKGSGAKVVAISNAHRKFLEANKIRVAETIYNGVNVLPPVPQDQTLAFRERMGLKGPTILFGGRLSEDKGIGALLDSLPFVLRECPEAQLLIAGEHERISGILDAVPTEYKPAVILAGWLPKDQMRVAYSAATVVATPSLCFDPFNIMNIEAMAEGIPVVATSLGGAPEIILEGITGTIVNPRSTKQFAQALTGLLQAPEKAKQMGRYGRGHVRKNFSLQKQCEAYLSVLDQQQNREMKNEE